MAAAPYKVLLVFAQGSINGPRIQYNCTASDVAAAAFVFPDGGTDATLPPTPCYLVDVVLSPAYGTDTTTSDIYANSKTTGYQITNSANQVGGLNRQYQVAPLGFQPGARIKFVQRA